MVPLTASVHAANASAPGVTPLHTAYSDGSFPPSNLVITVSNPASNQFPITSLTIQAPTGWTFNNDASFTCGGGLLGTPGAKNAGAEQCTGSLPPGFSTSLAYGQLVGALASSTAAVQGTAGSLVVDSSSGSYPGPTFKLYSIHNNFYAISDAGAGTMTAGTTDVVSLKPFGAGTAEAGIPIVFTVTPTTGGASLTVSSGFTDATGSISSTFSATGANAYTVKATPDCNNYAIYSDAITVNPASAAKVTITLPGSATSTAPNHYETNEAADSAAVAGAHTAAAGITYSLSDAFGNAINFNTLTAGESITLTALSGGGRFDKGGAVTKGALTCPGDFACPAAGVSAAIPFDYFQSTVYGTIGKLGVTIVATTPSTSVSGTSGNIITSSFAAGSPIPTVSAGAAAAGTTITVKDQVVAPIMQQGVPITLYLDVASATVNGDGMFSTSSANTINLASDSTGTVSAAYAVDTGLGASQDFIAQVANPVDGNAAHHRANSTGSAAVVTSAGPPAKFAIGVCFVSTGVPPCAAASTPGANAVNGTTLYVVVSITDAFSNPATNPGPSNIQINLATSSGLLSATALYITAAGSNTYTTFGWDSWTLPAGIGTKVTLTATGVLGGKSITATSSINTVSGKPTIAVTSPKPLSGFIYSSSTTVVFNGKANVSIGYPSTVKIASVGFKVGSSPWQTAVIVSGNKISWSLAASLPAGLSTIMFNATDNSAAGNTVVSSSYTVVVDTSAPTVTFTTTSGSVLNYSQPVAATVVDAQGELNATGVTATYNGTAVAAANVVVTGANNPGHSVTYTVSIKNLPVGHWTVALTAKDLAGNSASASINVKVQVAFAQSVVINTATYGTLGSFSGISVTATNVWSTSQNLVVFAVWKNGGGQTVAVTTGGLTLASGATGSTFAPLASALPTGSYSVTVFVITTGNNPVSSTTSLSVSV